jgi:hypothetical protein
MTRAVGGKVSSHKPCVRFSKSLGLAVIAFPRSVASSVARSALPQTTETFVGIRGIRADIDPQACDVSPRTIGHEIWTIALYRPPHRRAK